VLIGENAVSRCAEQSVYADDQSQIINKKERDDDGTGRHRALMIMLAQL
jgi:hypothetical protein